MTQLQESSLMGGLAAKRRAMSANKTTYIDVPGYEGDLVLRVKYVDYKIMKKSIDKVLRKKGDQDDRDVFAACDVLILATDEILMRVEEDLVPLGDRVTWASEDLDIALEFEEEPTTARERVLATFANTYAIFTVASAISRWMQDTSRDINEEFLGEAPGTMR